ncbi:hypothetical protein SynPROS71_02537 [Synechococcus sp. PROS-7-1]|nr:hypothetical protein SynPROS71_02537 [Synechococcus sp. PROS-7-1]
MVCHTRRTRGPAQPISSFCTVCIPTPAQVFCIKECHLRFKKNRLIQVGRMSGTRLLVKGW